MQRSKKLHKNRSFFVRFRLLFGLILILPLTLAGLTGFSALQFENRDASCAACHTQPESTYFQRETSASPSDLASFHAVKDTRCIDCHSNKGSAGRAAALMLGARDLMAFLSRSYAQPAPLTRAIGDGNCLKCHSGVSQRQDFNNHFHVFLPQWQKADPNAAACVDCHQGHSTRGSSAMAFLNEDTTRSVCQECHNFAGARG